MTVPWKYRVGATGHSQLGVRNTSKDLVRNLPSFIRGSEVTYLICWQLILELLHLGLCIMDDAFSHVHSLHTFLGKRDCKGLLHSSLVT